MRDAARAAERIAQGHSRARAADEGRQPWRVGACRLDHAPSLTPLRPSGGGGTQLSSGAAVLEWLGLGEQLAAAAVPLRSVKSRKADGTQLLRLDLGDALTEAGAQLIGGDGAFAIMRDALQNLLFSPLPPGTVQFNKELVEAEEMPGASGGPLGFGGEMRLKFADGSEHTADLLVGADGIGSTVKSQCFPSETPK